MQVSLIVAIADNDVIGKRGSLLPWRLPADLVHFKQITIGRPIIMGRTTYETIGHPLPDRLNIIISRDEKYVAEGCTVARSIEEALDLARDKGEVFIIGGAAIFEQTQSLASKIYLTRVHASPEGDVFFRYDHEYWRETDIETHPADNKNQYAYSFSILTRQ